MEPVTHVLTGACLARSGLNRRAAYATAAMAIAAELPDIDTVWSLRGPVQGFQHHRGITHTFAGLPFEAALLLLGFVVYHRLRSRRALPPGVSQQTVVARRRRGQTPAAPVRWSILYGLILLALLSHLLLDYTNNYGVRPFFPFQDRWYAGSFVFIFDPLLFLFLVAGLVLPSLFSFISREVGAAQEPFPGRGWARSALLAVLTLWSLRWYEHGKAVAAAQTQILRAPGNALATASTTGPYNAPDPSSTDSSLMARPLLLPQRSLASPDPLSPFRWYTATDFGPAYRLSTVDSRLETVTPEEILVKAPMSSALMAAEASLLGRVYLDWSPMPFVQAQNGTADSHPALVETETELQTVTFTDLRFLGDVPLLRRGGRAPLTGQVVLDAKGQVLAEGMDSRFER